MVALLSLKYTTRWWELVRRQLSEDVCKGSYQPFASLPRTVMYAIIEKLSGQLLADACICQQQLVDVTGSADVCYMLLAVCCYAAYCLLCSAVLPVTCCVACWFELHVFVN